MKWNFLKHNILFKKNKTHMHINEEVNFIIDN
jgi:hypothetical protein